LAYKDLAVRLLVKKPLISPCSQANTREIKFSLQNIKSPFGVKVAAGLNFTRLGPVILFHLGGFLRIGVEAKSRGSTKF
jgi:hypothetical protein